MGNGVMTTPTAVDCSKNALFKEIVSFFKWGQIYLFNVLESLTKRFCEVTDRIELDYIF